jgi:hypothetical protein
MSININISGFVSDIDTKRIETLYPGAALRKPSIATTTNIQLGNVAQQLAGIGTNILGSLSGIPQVTQIGNSLLELSDNYSIYSKYAVADVSSMRSLPGLQYPDFRSTKGFRAPLEVRIDGASAVLRGSKKAITLATLSASPLGPYSVFNLDGAGKTGYGWGDHGNPYALRNDFTAQSHVATQWDPAKIEINKRTKVKTIGGWVPTKNPIALATAFRGDRVNVIDFGKRTLQDAYRWKPRRTVVGANLDKLGITQDLIEFYFTGPELQASAASSMEDDIIVFRAIMNSLSDTFSPSWTAQQMIGRADPNYHYTQVTRDIQLDFVVYATDRDELKPIWRKLNALAGYTAPEYDKESIALKAPWLRFTIGDLWKQQAAFITSLTYTLHDSDTTWEINLEDDPTMMQCPHKVSVSIGLTPIMDQLPQKGGRFYTLAKQFDLVSQPIPGNDNWLSDAIPNPDVVQDNIEN